jgi:hypothetical protein
VADVAEPVVAEAASGSAGSAAEVVQHPAAIIDGSAAGTQWGTRRYLDPDHLDPTPARADHEAVTTLSLACQ